MQEIRGYYLLITQTFKFMKAPKIICTVAALAFSIAASQAVETDPVGFVSVTVPANSDATIALPLNRTSVFKGTISSITGSTITVAGTPGWSVNQLVFNGPNDFGADQLQTYAVQISSGSLEGLTAKITANSNSSISVQLEAGDTLSGAVGASIDIMPYWTPSTIFGSASVPIGTQLLGFQAPTAGINLGNSEQYTCSGLGIWEDDILFGEDGTNAPLKFGAGFIIRNPTASQLTLSMVGGVPMSTHRIRISTLASNTAQDISFGFMSPVPEKLSTVGDPSVPLVQRTSNFLQFPVSVGDQILGFDNSTAGINKGNSIQFTWNGTEWEDDINFGNVADYLTTLKPGFGYIYRKSASPTPSSLVWSRLPSYLQ